MRWHAAGATAAVPHAAAAATPGPRRVHGGAAGLQRGATSPTAMGERCMPGHAGEYCV